MAHARSGRADHLCESFLTNLPNYRLGRGFFAEIRQKQKTRANRFSLELNNWSVRSSSIRPFRLNKSAMNNSLETRVLIAVRRPALQNSDAWRRGSDRAADASSRSQRWLGRDRGRCSRAAAGTRAAPSSPTAQPCSSCVGRPRPDCRSRDSRTPRARRSSIGIG